MVEGPYDRPSDNVPPKRHVVAETVNTKTKSPWKENHENI